MARFNLEVAIHRTTWLSQEYPERFKELSATLSLTAADIANWEDVYKRLYVPMATENGVIEQFAGFFSLIHSILVPMSGEIRISSALSFGLKLASQIHVPIDLLHVVKGDSKSGSSLETTGDQPHHEYRERLDRVLAEGSPFSDMKERALVRKLYDVQGSLCRCLRSQESCSTRSGGACGRERP